MTRATLYPSLSAILATLFLCAPRSAIFPAPETLSSKLPCVGAPTGLKSRAPDEASGERYTPVAQRQRQIQSACYSL